MRLRECPPMPSSLRRAVRCPAQSFLSPVGSQTNLMVFVRSLIASLMWPLRIPANPLIDRPGALADLLGKFNL